ncbi:MAG: ABC transporter ATP-binding protein [Salaquimonas sp.]|jgi:branched-chain amino acid transport system ATP-binding protein|nr:ABC transporter ATP-binding protein [Salaquimonas sp.]
MSFLSIADLTGGYGQMTILNSVNLSLEKGEIGVIVGPNGAGKSTLLKAMFGLVNVTGGTITIEDEDITRLPPDRFASRRIAFVPQEYNIFPTLTVNENLEMGAYSRSDDFSAIMEHVYDIFPPLRDKRDQVAGELSGGQRQMVAVGRALMIEPRLLLLDEPTAGLSPMFMSEIFDRVIAVNRTGVTIVMVEQNAKQALAIATTGFVLANGANAFTDTGKNLLANPEVAKSFLGG